MGIKMFRKPCLVELLICGINCSLHVNWRALCSFLEEPSMPAKHPGSYFFSFSNSSVSV